MKTDWGNILKSEFEKPYFIELKKNVDLEYQNFICYPKYEDIFRALYLTPYKDTKVVILGQDPYHNPGEAMGLAFSVKKGVRVPPSLRNIFQELYSDLGVVPETSDLTSWATQGVLLLNSVLTVRENKPGSHKTLGWERFTDAIISKLNEKTEPVIFVLWGSYARSKKALINRNKHYIIESVHPSPLSAYNGFFGSNPFSKINQILDKCYGERIDFSLGGSEYHEY